MTETDYQPKDDFGVARRHTRDTQKDRLVQCMCGRQPQIWPRLRRGRNAKHITFSTMQMRTALVYSITLSRNKKERLAPYVVTILPTIHPKNWGNLLAFPGDPDCHCDCVFGLNMDSWIYPHSPQMK